MMPLIVWAGASTAMATAFLVWLARLPAPRSIGELRDRRGTPREIFSRQPIRMLPVSTLLPADERSHPWRRRWLGSRDYWLFQWAGWGSLALVVAFTEAASITHQTTWFEAVGGGLVQCVAGILCTHLLRVVLLFFRRRRTTWRAFLCWLPLIVVATGAALFNLVLFVTVSSGQPIDVDELPITPAAYLVAILTVALGLAVWVGFYFGYHSWRGHQQALLERLRLDAAIKEAELRALRSQVNPHFLFNSLNTLRALMPRELARPREAVTLLADLLRASLTLGSQRTIRLEQELETVENYLALEQLRFEARLRVRFAIAPEARPRALPPFALQTLVENAIKFGVEPFEEGGDIAIHASIRGEDGALEVTVTNPGRVAAASASTGLGLKNTRARLLLLFGPQADTALEQIGAGVVARLVVPAPATPQLSLT